MFVVRLKRPNEDFDLKAFATKRAALARFRAAQRLMLDSDLQDCELFEAKALDAKHAIELVNRGHATLIESNLEDPRPRTPTRKRPAAKKSTGPTRTKGRRAR